MVMGLFQFANWCVSIPPKFAVCAAQTSNLMLCGRVEVFSTPPGSV